MIILRNKVFSMIDTITGKLNSSGIVDFSVEDHVPKDEVSILGDLKNTKIFIPEDYEDEIYRIDDLIRSEARFLRTKIEADPGKSWLRIIDIQGSLTLAQYIKIVKFIIDETDSCVIVNL